MRNLAWFADAQVTPTPAAWRRHTLSLDSVLALGRRPDDHSPLGNLGF